MTGCRVSALRNILCAECSGRFRQPELASVMTKLDINGSCSLRKLAIESVDKLFYCNAGFCTIGQIHRNKFVRWLFVHNISCLVLHALEIKFHQMCLGTRP